MSTLAKRPINWLPTVILLLIISFQIITHLMWLPISTQVGQLGIPYLLSQGMSLFGNVIENRPPASAAILALCFQLFPSIEPILIVRMLNLALVVGMTLVIYMLAQKLSGSVLAGIFATIFWALWEPVFGNILFYFDTLVGALFALTVLIWLKVEAHKSNWIAPFLCGILLASATLFKQPAWASVILFALWLIWIARRGKHIPAFLLGVATIHIITIIIFMINGTLEGYLFWNFERYFGGIPNGSPLTGAIIRKLLMVNILAPAFLLHAIRSDAKRRSLWLLVGMMWLAGGATLFPNFGEIYTMGHLPLIAVMSGIVIALTVDSLSLNTLIERFKQANSTSITLVGIALAIMIGWGWTIAAAYMPAPLGRASIPAYDEFKPVAARLLELRQANDSLYILPMSDGNSQLYALTNMLPPGTWMTSHNVFLDVAGVTENLLAEWEVKPPDWIVDFPDQRHEFEPGVIPLAEFMYTHYHMVEQIEDIPFNGVAVIYRLNTSP